MKINRFIALALIALLVVGAMGILSYRAIAQPNTAHGAQDCSAETEDEGTGEVEDTDGVENACGDQTEGEANDDNGAALQGQATIPAEEAEATVLAKYPGARVLESELENEGGTLLYSFELDNGTEVEVDASDGTLLSTTGEEDSD